jgi:molybdenum cofactor cytidylyltransferase
VTAGAGIAAVILAAGAGRRLGGVAKALLAQDGRTYLAAIAATARSVGLVDAVVVVAEPFGREVAAHARQLGLRVRVNPSPERGMASSVALGFAAIANGPASAAWLWPVDHPAVQAATLGRLIIALGDANAADAIKRREVVGGGDGFAGGSLVGSIAAEVAQPRHAGRGGHPPLIARALWPRLASCAGAPDGARGVLRTARMISVEVDDPGVVHDVDTPADLEARA